MATVKFLAHGHENVLATHRSTLEITKEKTLTKRGDCVVCVGAELALADLDQRIKSLALNPETIIRLVLRVEDFIEKIVGYGSAGLSYSSPHCMIARKSTFECEKTLMVRANKAAIDIDRQFVKLLQNPETVVDCTLEFILKQ